MGNHGWVEIDYRKAWAPFDARFAFQPWSAGDPTQVRRAYAKAGRAAILEPTDSVTYSISGIYGDEQRYQEWNRELADCVVHCFRSLLAPGAHVVALDWQHPSYSWRCHEQGGDENPDDWPVPVLPNGDYCIFFKPDLAWGLFGHPWEESICAWGTELVKMIKDAAPRALGEVIRVGGRQP
jgi:hypothetical protein